MAELFNANHFIVSQANPIIVHFIDNRRQYMNSRRKWITKAVHYFSRLVIMEISHRLQQIISLKLFPKSLVRFFNLLTQDYTGHITIKFTPSLSDYTKVIQNPDREQTRYFRDAGEVQCFTEMSRVRVFMKIEKAISEVIHAIKQESVSRHPDRKLSIIKEAENDKDDSVLTEKERERHKVLQANEENAQLADDYWKYIHNFDENVLNSPTNSPRESGVNRFFETGGLTIARKKSSDSFHSLSSMGGTLK